MKLEDYEINDYLQEHYDYLVKKYSKANILGLFTVGTANYGFAEKTKEITLVAIYLPSFEELCTQPAENHNLNDIYIVDIRRLYNCLETCEWGALELLFSNYKILNPLYENTFTKFFINNRNKIADYDKMHRIIICYNRAQNAILNQNYYEAARLRIAADLYLNGVNCDEVFHLKKDYHTDYLWAIKHHQKDINPMEITNDFLDMIEAAKGLDNSREEIDKIIKAGIVAIMSNALEEKVSIDSFYDCLTKTEKEAMKEVINRLDENGVGNISIMKIVEETGISRPVFKNLFVKPSSNVFLINSSTLYPYFLINLTA